MISSGTFACIHSGIAPFLEKTATKWRRPVEVKVRLVIILKK
jgi:hypothetical protein